MALQKVKTTCLRQFSGFIISRHITQGAYPGAVPEALEGLILQLWVGTRSLYFKALFVLFWYRERYQKAWECTELGVADRPLDSYSTVLKSQLLRGAEGYCEVSSVALETQTHRSHLDRG